MTKPRIDFARFYVYDDLCRHMKDLADWKPDWATVSTFGASYEGRPLLMLTITAPTGVAPEDKPIFFVNGNLHASELSGSTCALFLAHHLLEAGEADPTIRSLLEAVTFQIVPRINPDGAEQVLRRHHLVRSRSEYIKEKNRIYPQDINGDGKILWMRMEDPNGPLVALEEDPRVLMPVLPGETNSKRYRFALEGLIHDWDGGAWTAGRWFSAAGTFQDFNRNWPFNWAPLHEQYGSGEYPLSEPETRALADHIIKSRNIFALLDFHCGARALLLPNKDSSSPIPGPDIYQFRRIGRLWNKLTGYDWMPSADYRQVDTEPGVSRGHFGAWTYWHRGLFGLCVELGYIYSSAGYDVKRHLSVHENSEASRIREREAVALSDAYPEEQGFHDWTPFDHPQLGPVEIGWWNPAFLGNVVPPERVPVWKNVTQFCLALAEERAQLQITDVQATAQGEGVFQIEYVVANRGCMPTSQSARGAVLTHMGAVVAEVDRDGEIEFLAGRNRVDLGHLDAGAFEPLRCVVKAPHGGRLTLRVSAPHCGTDTYTIELVG